MATGAATATKAAPKAAPVQRAAVGRPPPAPKPRASDGLATARETLTRLAPRAQAKLTIGSPNDPAEHEADRMAERVMRQDTPLVVLPTAPALMRKCACGSSGASCPACEEEKKLQRAPASAAPSTAGSGILPLAGGAPLASRTRAFFEPRFGADFSAVRIHTGTAAATAARTFAARAFTLGADVAFAPGQYAPESVEGRRLLAHELAHVAQQGRAPAQPHTAVVQRKTVVPPQPGDDPALVALLNDEIEAAEAGGDQNVDLMLRASASRMFVLLTSRPRTPFKTQADLDRFIAGCEALAATELGTMNELGRDGSEWALAGTPKGFPLTWAGRVRSTLSLGVDIPTLLAGVAESRLGLTARGVELSRDIFAHGLPVSLGELERVRDFRLRLADANAEKDSHVRVYARAGIRHMQVMWLSTFAYSWEKITGQVADAVAAGDIVVSYLHWQDFVKNKEVILRDLPARARRAETEEDAQQFQSDAVKLADAALLMGQASVLYSLLSLLGGWTEVSDGFGAALRAADEAVAQSDDGGRIIAALRWSWDNDYFSGAFSEAIHAMIANGPEALKEIGWIFVWGMIPGVNLALPVYLAVRVGVDVLALIGETAAAFMDCMHARTVSQLQQAAARLARVLLAGGIFAAVVLITEGVGRAAARLRARSQQLRAVDKALTEEAATRKAMEELSAEERRALRGGSKAGAVERLSRKFEPFAGACALGSIICRFKLPDQVLAEGGPYPTAMNVPMPKGPFHVQKAALTGATRVSKTLQREVLKDPSRWPHFEKALKASGGKWPEHPPGTPWQVHHIKPVSMGGGSNVENLFPLPGNVHKLYTDWWGRLWHGFKNRFDPDEWELIYTSQKNIPGSRVPATRK
jgi:hypothetical protein